MEKEGNAKARTGFPPSFRGPHCAGMTSSCKKFDQWTEDDLSSAFLVGEGEEKLQ